MTQKQHTPIEEWLKILLPVTNRHYVAPSENDAIILKKFQHWATEKMAYHRPEDRLFIKNRTAQAVKIMHVGPKFFCNWKNGQFKEPHAIYAAIVEPAMLPLFPDLPRPSHSLVEWVRWLIDEWKKEPWKKKKGRLPLDPAFNTPLPEIKSRYVLDEEDIFSPPVRRIVAVDTPGNTDAVESEKQEDTPNGIDGQGIAGPHR